jgi:hypothetical protein
VWDIRRLVADDTPAVMEELKRLRNTRYHDRPVSLYGGMVDLPSRIGFRNVAFSLRTRLGFRPGRAEWEPGSVGPGKGDLVREEVPQDDFQARDRFQGPQIGSLPQGLFGVACSPTDSGSGVLDAEDVVRGKEEGCKSRQVEPFVGGASDGPVIEVEAVDIDEGPHPTLPMKSRSRPEDRLRTLPPRRQGGYESDSIILTA